MAADDFNDIPAGQGIPDLDTSAPFSGNRPASGARRATPGEVLSQGFQGAQNAGDFLGLDTEFTASQDPNQVFGASSPLDLVPPPSTYDGDPQSVPEPAPMPAGDPAQDFAEAPSAFEFGEDLGSEEGEQSASEDGAPSRGPQLVRALLVAGLVGGAVYYGNILYTRYFGAPTEVAVAPVAPGAKPGANTKTPSTDSPAPAKPATDPSVASKDPSADAKPSTTAPSSKDAKKPAVSTRTPSASPGTGGARKPEPVATAEQAQPEGGASLPSSTGADHKSPSSFPDLASNDFEWASSDLLELIWRGNEVPLQAVHAPAKTLMPRVGTVRVLTTAGDVFEGRLYAVGQDRVWVDAEPGRIGLDGARVEKIEVLGQVAASVQPNVQEKELVGKKRVRVRVPGGMLYGSVLKSEGEEVVLALDDGGRVRVKAGDIEDLGSGRAVVVRR
jgi:hypothetical protein